MKRQISLKLNDPRVKILIIILVISFSAYMAAQNIIIKPNKNRIAQLKSKLEHIKIENEIAKLYNEISACGKIFPPQNDQSWLLAQITTLAKQSNLNIDSIEPLPAKQIPPYTYIPFKIKTNCNFNELQKIIELIESSQYVINIESLKLDSQAKYKSEISKDEFTQKGAASIEIVIGTIY